jgi:hypothetical protein
MFFSRFGDRTAHSPTVSKYDSIPSPINMLDGSSLPGPSQPDGEEWKVVYRQAYKQLVEGSGPTAFRRATRPSEN